MQHSQIGCPLVSYVMACYNHEPYIEQMIRSILNQSVKELELLIIDDGSTDGSLQIIQKLANQDSRIRLIPSPSPGENIGIVSARNAALMLACAEFISIVDSDDLLPEDRTERLLNTLIADPNISIAYGDAWIIDSSAKRIKRFSELHPTKNGDFSQELFYNYCFVPAISVMFRRKMLLASGPLWGAAASCDYIKWIELGLFGRAVCISGEVLGFWRRHSGNLSQISGQARAKQYQDLLTDLETILVKYPKFRASLDQHKVQQRYAKCHFMSGFFLGLASNWQGAKAAFIKAWQLNPRLIYAFAWLSCLPIINRISLGFYRYALKLKSL